MDFERRKAWAGRLFVLPWVIGAAIFFFYPLIQSLYFTFNEMDFLPQGGFELTRVGLTNYSDALFRDAYFLENLVEAIQEIAISLPLILLFSLFAAVLLNMPLKNRGLIRMVFFVPVVMTSGALFYLMLPDRGGAAGAGSNLMLGNMNMEFMLSQIIHNQSMVETITNAMDQVFDIIWRSGIQTLLFLAGLQSISPSLYECASVEGASAWEKYWKITVPLVSPIILVNIVYTVVDTFSDYGNSMLRYVLNVTFSQLRFTYGTTMAWLYFLTMAAILGLLFFIISKFVFYTDEDK